MLRKNSGKLFGLVAILKGAIILPISIFKGFINQEMEKLTNNQGFKHIAETIFLQLDPQILETCRDVNKSWKKILEDPSFWLKKCFQFGLLKSSSEKTTASAWTNSIQIVKNNSNLEMKFLSLLKEFFSFGTIFGYISTPIQFAATRNCWDIVEALALMTENPNKKDPFGWTPIQRAAVVDGNSKIIELLAPMSTDNPNATDPYGWTPIQRAACYLNDEKIIRCLVSSLSPNTNPNAIDPDGWTPIQRAANWGNTEIVKILAPSTDDPNYSGGYGNFISSPIQIAESLGYHDIVRILRAYTTKNIYSY